MSWQSASLGDCIELVSGAAFKSAMFTDNPDDVPLVKGENIGQGEILWDKSRYWPATQFEEYSKLILKPDDIVLAMDRPWVTAGLKYAIISDRDPVSLLVQRVARIRPLTNADAKFLKHIIGSRSFLEYIKGIMGGTNVPHISGRQIRDYKCRLPDVDTQQRIAAVLSAYDNLIENNGRRIVLLEAAARQLYKEWFVRFRFPGHEHVKIVNGVPTGWTEMIFSEVAEVVRGRSYTSAELRDEGGRAFVNLKCINRFGGFRDSGLKGIEGIFKERHMVVPGDIVMAVTDMTRDAMIVAQSGRISKTVEAGAIFSMDLVKIVPKHEIQRDWLYSLLRFSQFAFNVREHANGTNVLHLKPKHIEDWKGVVPPQDIRESFVDAVQVMFDQIDNLQVQSRNATKARDLLLPKLMSGAIAV